MVKYRPPKFVSERRYDIGHCPSKGKDDFCDGKQNYPQCTVKYALFGLIANQKGWKNYQRVDESSKPCRIDKGATYRCPEYVEWAIPWKGKEERIGIVDGGQLKGFKKKGRGPCVFQTIKSTNTELLDVIDDLFGLVSKGNEDITKYLEKNLHAPKDIRKRALKMATHYNKPKFED